MKLILALLLFCSPAFATWTLTQVKDTTTCNGTTCAVTVTSTGSAHLLVAGILPQTTSTTITGVTAGACTGSWTHAASTNTTGVDLYYCLNSVSGQTSITITGSGSIGTGAGIAIIWEAASSLGTIAVDSGATPSGIKSDTTCTACAGVTLTLSGNNDFIAGLANCGGTCSNLVGTGFTNDLSNPGSDGVMHGITSASLTAPTTWTQTSGTLICNAAAFQETGAAGTGNSMLGGPGMVGGPSQIQ